MNNLFSITMKAVEKESDLLRDIQKAMDELNEHEVYVGVPKESSAQHLKPDGTAPVTPINNAHLLYIHSYGSPVRRIPSREVLEPALKHHKDEWSGLLRDVTEQALQGNASPVLPGLKKIGIYAANVSQDWFTNPANGWRAITEATIKAKSKKGARKENPLIDTDELRKSITYVVKKR